MPKIKQPYMEHNEFCKRLSVELGVSNTKAQQTLKTVIKTTQDALLEGYNIKIAGLGAFYLQRRNAQDLKSNLVEGGVRHLPAKTRVAFRPYEQFNRPLEDKE